MYVAFKFLGSLTGDYALFFEYLEFTFYDLFRIMTQLWLVLIGERGGGPSIPTLCEVSFNLHTHYAFLINDHQLPCKSSLCFDSIVAVDPRTLTLRVRGRNRGIYGCSSTASCPTLCSPATRLCRRAEVVWKSDCMILTPSRQWDRVPYLRWKWWWWWWKATSLQRSGRRGSSTAKWCRAEKGRGHW